MEAFCLVIARLYGTLALLHPQVQQSKQEPLLRVRLPLLGRPMEPNLCLRASGWVRRKHRAVQFARKVNLSVRKSQESRSAIPLRSVAGTDAHIPKWACCATVRWINRVVPGTEAAYAVHRLRAVRIQLERA
jgi:hypothetical protein